MIYVNFKRLTETAQVPTKGSAGAAGYDLYADEEVAVGIPPGETVVLSTGIAAEIPAGYAGILLSRSGISVRKGLRIASGSSLIDADYRGNIRIPLYNDSNVVQIVEPHERVAQLVFQHVEDAMWHEVSELTPTKRGEGGFGSTGT